MRERYGTMRGKGGIKCQPEELRLEQIYRNKTMFPRQIEAVPQAMERGSKWNDGLGDNGETSGTK